MKDSDAIADMIGELLKNEGISEFLKKNVEDVAKKLSRRAGEIITTENLKMAWNYEEKNTLEYSFDEAVGWIKTNLPKNIVAAVIYKEASGDNLKLHVCFLDSEDNPLLNGDTPHLVVNTKKLDNELINNFGDKDLLILK